ncbi:MAG: ATP-binding protein [Succinivibrio sp.]|nr:ATP-binding protein [Succinivibrio sp.]
MEYRRKQFASLKERLLEPRKFLQVVVGPRQVGKTTLVSQVLGELTIPHTLETADGVDPKDSNWLHLIWESARATMMIRRSTEYLLVVDEVQKLENWSEAVKREWDADTLRGLNLKVVLLGSSRLLLKRGLTESLAGRYELIRMPHWSYAEMRAAFNVTLDEYIYFGGYPGAAHLMHAEGRWRKYLRDALIAVAIEKDVLLTSHIYKPALLRQLFDLGCSYSAEILSLTKLMGQLQDAGNVTTLAGYLMLLAESNLLTALPKYAQDEARKRGSIPKFQVFNNALLTSCAGRSFVTDRTDTAAWGRWVESAVGAHLLSAAEELNFKLYYWRERAGGKAVSARDLEVDFIIEHSGELMALEVKSGRRGMNAGLPCFEQRFKPKRSLLVGTGGVSVEDFLSCDPESLLSW